MIISSFMERNHGKWNMVKNAQFVMLESMNMVSVRVVLAEIEFSY